MPRQVAIRLDGMRAAVSPGDAAAVAPLLAERVHSFAAGPAGVVGRSLFCSLGRSEDGDFFFPAKLAPYVAARLRERGYRPSIAYPTWPRPTAPDQQVLDLPTGPAARLLGKFEHRLGALVRFAAEAHPQHLVPDLLRAYPRARAVVGVPNRDQVRGWIQRLREAGLGRPVVSPAEYLEYGLPRPIVLVCSLAQMDNCPAENFDLAVVPDARPLRGLDARPPEEYDPRDDWDYRPVSQRNYDLLRHWHVPAFGFMPQNFRLTAAEEVRLWALFGRTVDLGGVRPARVQVIGLRGPRLTESVPDAVIKPVEYKKRLWGDDDRNQTVAELAAELANGDADALQRYGIESATADQVRVAVLVESPAHADRLAALLPGWAVRRNDSPGITPTDPLDRVIVTELWAAGQRRLDADVLIDARGWNSVSLPGFPPHVPDGDRLVNLVDVGVGDIGGMRKTAARLREYRRRGWAVREA